LAKKAASVTHTKNLVCSLDSQYDPINSQNTSFIELSPIIGAIWGSKSETQRYEKMAENGRILHFYFYFLI